MANNVHRYTFATLNMENYPPSTESAPTLLKQTCDMIQARNHVGRPWDALAGVLRGDTAAAVPSPPPPCIDLHAQLPMGENATISSGDWSGVGVGQNGANWDYQTCTFLVEPVGTNNVTDMFLPRKWTMEWMTQHCQSRFGVTPDPTSLNELWGFGRFQSPEGAPTSHIIFTNGLKDGWSVGSFLTETDADHAKEIHVLNMPNGAHHSDLAHVPPGPSDTPDVQWVHAQVEKIVGRWLEAHYAKSRLN